MPLSSVIPSLLAGDLGRTLEFYETLGFCLSGGGAGGGWLEVRRDAVVLQFYTDPPVGTAPSPMMSGTIYVRADGVAELATEFAGKVPFEWGLEQMEYGALEFAVRDPNGYLIAFTAPERIANSE